MPRRKTLQDEKTEVVVLIDGGYVREFIDRPPLELLKERLLEALVQRTPPGSSFKFLYWSTLPHQGRPGAEERYENFKRRLAQSGFVPIESRWSDCFIGDLRGYMRKFSDEDHAKVSKRVARYSGFLGYFIGRFTGKSQIAVLADCFQVTRSLEDSAQVLGKQNYLVSLPGDNRAKELHESVSPEFVQCLTLDLQVPETEVVPTKKEVFKKKLFDESVF